ncbi:SDR family oxidoreductase [Salmonella enterica]|nr:SDR family oxidoreductase [Salmonella enterica]
MTGGARGIGRATALALAARGEAICIVYRTREAICIVYRTREACAQEVVETIRQLGGEALAIQADIASEEQVVALFRRIDSQLGPLTGLVNNAAMMCRQASIEALTSERLAAMFATNVTGSFLCAREAVKRMSHRHGGRGGAIVNVSSAASRLGAPHEYLDYAASKGAIDTFTTGLSLEVAAQGIRVNAVRPGFIYTDMHADGGEPGRVDRIRELIPMKRGGTPEEVAQAIVWLLSDKASYVTGSFIDLAGGK